MELILGISICPLSYLAKQKIEFGKTLTLGKQDNNLYGDIAGCNWALATSQQKNIPKAEVFVNAKDGSAIIKHLGAKQVLSLDASDYEECDFIHDLNKPVPKTLYNQFDTIIDGGTLEHVFNIPQAISNITKMLKKGGHFIGLTTANNYLGHGFYQFSPEFVWRAYAAYGFEVLDVNLCAREEKPPKFYSIPDPDVVEQRLEIRTGPSRIDIMFTCKLINKNKALSVQQSDYSTKWKKT